MPSTSPPDILSAMTGENALCQDQVPCRNARVATRLGALAAVILICAGIRIWLIRHTEVIAGDGTTYVRMAQQWLSDPGGVVDDYLYAPGYPAAMAAVHEALDAAGLAHGRDGWELSGQIVSLVASAGAIVALWCFAGMAFNWRVAWISALLFGVSRKWSALGADVLSDALAVCLQMWALVLAVAVANLLRNKSRWALVAAAGAGLCGGLGYLVRPESLIVVFLGIVLWLIRCLRERLSRPLTLGAIACAAATAATCAVPYMIAIGGLSKKKTMATFALQPRSGGSPFVAAGGMLAWSGIDDSSVVEFAAEMFEAMHPVVGILACLYLVVWACRKFARLKLPGQIVLLPRGDCAFMSLGVTAIFAVVLIRLHTNVGYLSERHAMFPAACLAPFAGAAMIAIVEGIALLAKLLRLPLRRTVISVVLAGGIAAAMVSLHTLRPLHEGKVHFRRAAEYARQQAGPEGLVLADHAWLIYYCHAPCEAVVPTNRGRVVAKRLRNQIIGRSASYLALTARNTIAPKRNANDPGPARELVKLLQPPAIVEVRIFTAGPDAPGAESENLIRVYRVDRAKVRVATKGATGPS